ncbi:MAG: hypothetical protein WBD36_07285 [Bacteroidota bacterium]
MKISVRDASNYFKGLLLLVRKDLRIDNSEVEMMKRVGKSLGFEPGFCENAIQDILESTYIADVPPEFSSRELATKFVRDGLAVALGDHDFHPAEEEWLRSVAKKNQLDLNWFLKERDNFLNSPKGSLEVENLTVE